MCIPGHWWNVPLQIKGTIGLLEIQANLANISSMLFVCILQRTNDTVDNFHDDVHMT